ncbi:2099_t:CDS:1, partial [Racocetra fulgida]
TTPIKFLLKSQPNYKQPNDNIENLMYTDDNEFLSCMFGTTTTNPLNEDEIEKYLQIKEIS